MPITIDLSLLDHTESPSLLKLKSTARYGSSQITIAHRDLTDEVLDGLIEAAQATNARGVLRAAKAIAAARSGANDQKIPKFEAAEDILRAWMSRNLTDGWLFRRGLDGHLHAWLVTRMHTRDDLSRTGDSTRLLIIDLVANAFAERGMTTVHETLTFPAESLIHRTPATVFEDCGAYVSTPDLLDEYRRHLADFAHIVATGFAEQYRYTGTPVRGTGHRGYARTRRDNVKVIHDLAPSQTRTATSDYAESMVLGPGVDAAPTPTQFLLPVFDLSTHTSLVVNARDLTRYVYDASLREKIVLPADQRNLLDILTTDVDVYTGDVIEGKSTGNVILCKGRPGVGKTLTAEIYSEVIERPLYALHSGMLGVSPESVRDALEVAFKRAKRWNVVLLLDEADVFILERGTDLTQNAIGAEFLRTLEYFDGLLFMTTNRGDDIDDAILSRAAAIIDYTAPGGDSIGQVWQIQAENQGHQLDPQLLDQLVSGFADITPRDVKMLLRLALRVARAHDKPLDIETVASCAMFRGLHYVPAEH